MPEVGADEIVRSAVSPYRVDSVWGNARATQPKAQTLPLPETKGGSYT